MVNLLSPAQTKTQVQGNLFGEDTHLSARTALHVIGGKQVWDIDTLQKKMERFHINAIGLLAPTFRIQQPANLPIRISSDGKSVYGAILQDWVTNPDAAALYQSAQKRVLTLFLNHTMLRSETEAELTCAHESGHYCHILLREESDFIRSSFNKRELVAILSSLLVFESYGRWTEAVKIIESKAEDDEARKHEIATIMTVAKLGIKISDALDVAVNQHNHWKLHSSLIQEYEENLESMGVKR